MKVFFSVIIPVRSRFKKINKRLTLALKAQTFKKFEVLITSKPINAGPALKRDLAAQKAKGEVLAFLDDDAYPDKNWLKNAFYYFKNKKNRIAAVCGPGITPKNSPFSQKASGYILSSFMGSGGAGTYRNRPEKKREVDDYPSFNLLVRKSDFWKVGGFKTSFWPGEDTKLCHNLVYKLGKKIVYDPKILVYHHRRALFIPHLKQISRFGLHRGYFVRLWPKTSLKIGYFIPSFFLIFLSFTPMIFLLLKSLSLNLLARLVLEFYLTILILYFALILLAPIDFLFKEKKICIRLCITSALSIFFGIFFTHITYGFYFLKGLFIKKMNQ